MSSSFIPQKRRRKTCRMASDDLTRISRSYQSSSLAIRKLFHKIQPYRRLLSQLRPQHKEAPLQKRPNLRPFHLSVSKVLHCRTENSFILGLGSFTIGNFSIASSVRLSLEVRMISLTLLLWEIFWWFLDILEMMGRKSLMTGCGQRMRPIEAEMTSPCFQLSLEIASLTVQKIDGNAYSVLLAQLIMVRMINDDQIELVHQQHQQAGQLYMYWDAKSQLKQSDHPSSRLLDLDPQSLGKTPFGLFLAVSEQSIMFLLRFLPKIKLTFLYAHVLFLNLLLPFYLE